jgi:hypothetical protein
VLFGWLAGCGLFLIAGVLTPVDLRYYLAAIPVVATLAGFGAVSLWSGGAAGRTAAAALLLWLLWVSVSRWIEPIV